MPRPPIQDSQDHQFERVGKEVAEFGFSCHALIIVFKYYFVNSILAIISELMCETFGFEDMPSP